jgi:hypothetical protein
MMSTLYRIVEVTGSNQGGRQIEIHNRRSIYCGYDRLEAVRVFREAELSDHNRGPGSQVKETVFQAGDVAEDGEESPEELEEVEVE